MASEPSRLKVSLGPQARRGLDEIWTYNAEVYGADHADAYVAFSKTKRRGWNLTTLSAGGSLDERT